MPTPTAFGLAKHASLRRLAGQLQRQFSLTPGGQHRSRWELYDSADGRLLSAGRVLVWEAEGFNGQLCLRELRNGRLLTIVPLPDPPPPLASELPRGRLSAELQRLLGDRRLFPLGLVLVRRLHFDVRDRDDKMVARLLAEECHVAREKTASAAFVAKQLVLEPLRGYEKAARHIERRLRTDFELMPAPHLFEQVLGLLGRMPVDASTRLKPTIDESTPADVGIARLLLWLLATMEANEAGILAGRDSECLHDFRVAVRKTRVVIRQLGNTFRGRVARFLGDFAWLGELAGRGRDLDVALLALEKYRNFENPDDSPGLESLAVHLRTRREREYENLAGALTSGRYRRLQKSWRRFLARSGERSVAGRGSIPSPSSASVGQPTAQHIRPIGPVIRQRSARLYKRMLRDARGLNLDSDGSAFHELRKDCKKLHYVITLFGEIYPADELEPLVRRLKRVQKDLGAHQDIEVQMTLIRQFLGDSPSGGAPPARERIAVDGLLEWYGQRKVALRDDFFAHFPRVNRDKNRKRFRALFETDQH